MFQNHLPKKETVKEGLKQPQLPALLTSRNQELDHDPGSKQNTHGIASGARAYTLMLLNLSFHSSLLLASDPERHGQSFSD